MTTVAQAYIRKRTVISDGGCWLWQLSCNNWGYGRAGDPVLGERAAHRIAYRAFIGDIPTDKRVLHDCPQGDNPACCNPTHLWLGDGCDNMQDMVTKRRHADLRGERAPLAKLTWTAVASIRTAQGKSISDIAREFNVSRRAIRFVLSGATWKTQ